MRVHRALRRRDEGDRGFTLIEMTISMMIFGIILGVMGSVVSSTKKSSDTVRVVNDLNSEARQAINRISRELRQSVAIESVSGTDGAAGLTFDVDFNGNKVIDCGTVDPERLTYRWDGNNIFLSAADSSGTTVTQPILSGNVSSFSLQYFSSRYTFDCDGNGSTTWQELDHGSCRPTNTPVGNGNNVLDAGELPYVDSVVLTFSVLNGPRKQHYRTQIDLRNAQ
jgi:prepilin-type N-terminal cleavage/methylation domain-containing protein